MSDKDIQISYGVTIALDEWHEKSKEPTASGEVLERLGSESIASGTPMEIKGLRRISFARNVTGIGRGVWVCLKELCARAERESQDRQNKYFHHLAITYET